MSHIKDAWNTQYSAVDSDDDKDNPQPPRPLKWKVAINDGLPTPTLGPWIAFGLSGVTVTVLTTVAFRESVLTRSAYLHPTVLQLFNIVRTLLNILITGFISGTAVKLWLHDICRPQPSQNKAESMSKLGKVLTGIAEQKDKLVFWKATLFIVLVALAKTSFDVALAPYYTYGQVPSRMSHLKNAFPRNCSNMTTNEPYDNSGYSCPVGNNSFVSAMAVAPDLYGDRCPWYFVASIFGPSAAVLPNTAYTLNGITVDTTAIGTPAIVGGTMSPFDSILGMDSNSLGASACLPVVVSNPVKCRALGPVAVDMSADTYTWGQQLPNCSFSESVTGERISSATARASWDICAAGQEFGQMTIAAGAIGGNADVYAFMMGDKAYTENNFKSYSVACDVDLKPAIAFRQVVYGQMADLESYTTRYGVWGLETCSPRSGLNQSVVSDATAMAVGLSGVQSFVMEDNAYTGWPALLTQMKRRNYTSFAESKNSLEDSLGLAIGATLGTYWGMVLPSTADNYGTEVKVQYVRLGPGWYWPVVYTVPFISMMVTLSISLRKKRQLDRLPEDSSLEFMSPHCST